MRLHLEEFESVRLCDYEGLTQQEASVRMGVSRPTLTRIYAGARRKIARALVEGLHIEIQGGSAYMDPRWYRCGSCSLTFSNINPAIGDDAIRCPLCGSSAVHSVETEYKPLIITDKMKKIVLPTREGRIDDHFGHCEFYTIITLDDNNNIVQKEEMPSPQGCGCKSNVASVFQQMGVTLMLAGNMGAGALNKLNAHGVEVVRGCSGDIMDVLKAYLEGRIKDSGEGCHHHHGSDDGHQCPHHDR